MGPKINSHSWIAEHVSAGLNHGFRDPDASAILWRRSGLGRFCEKAAPDRTVSHPALAPRIFNSPWTQVTAQKDAQPQIYCLIEDVFPVATISEAARRQSVKIEFRVG